MMTKIDSLRRILLPCFTISPSTTTGTASCATVTTKKRLSASLRDDIDDGKSPSTKPHGQQHPHQDSSTSSPSSSESVTSRVSHAPHRSSKSMVICTFFGERRSHVFFCVQIDRLSTKPALLLELSLSIHSLVKEMRSGLLRIALECSRSDLGSCPLHSVPLWTLYCNGRRVGSSARRKPTDDTRAMLKKMENTTVGAGVLPASSGSGRPGCGEVMYMRANYEWVVGGEDSESFHLISPDDCPGQELSVFLLRSG